MIQQLHHDYTFTKKLDFLSLEGVMKFSEGVTIDYPAFIEYMLLLLQFSVPVSKYTAGWYEAMDGVANSSNQDPELISTIDCLLLEA